MSSVDELELDSTSGAVQTVGSSSVQGSMGLEVVHMLQRQHYTDRPWLGITERGVGSTVAFKTVLGVSTIAGLGGVVALPLTIAGGIWSS